MTSDNNHENMKRWTKNPEARIFCINTLSALYALILTMIAFVIEISPTWRSQEMWLEYSIFGVLMYLFAILYFTYFYLFVIYPNIINSIIYFLHRRGRIASLHRWLLEEPVFNGEGAGTMYLRIGTLFFGSMGAVLYITEILLCFFDTQRNGIYVTKYTLAVAFIYMQMHFIFSNSKVLLKSSNAIAKFGLMHSVAVNLWTWLSICLIKSDMKHSKKEMKHAEDGLKNQTATNVLAQWSYNLTTNSFGAHDKQLRTIVKMGSSANLLLTCLVEFSLIAAVICFIIWKNDHPNPGNSEKKPKKQSVRFDCNGTSVGLFTAIFIHIISVVVIGLHGIYMKDHNEKVADQLIGYTDVLMFVILLFACLLALFQMRKLQYTSHVHGEVIDDILLIVGLAGECVYSCAAIDLYVNEKLMDRPVPYITMIAFSLRITEVIVQTLFILIAARMRSSPLSNKQPGKQVITFLLICNINLFIYHTFETTESSFGFPAKVSEVYTVMLTIASPIVVFYRFHSSACLAEIWKNTYLRNGHDANVGPADSNEKLMMIDKL
ncbi:Otopetrin-2 [Caenorhabditis elegans]|nr:Otopetrin-2 [Caenorhabditis elegans]CZR14552.1 Otopetrin-2 [Caenorhabditis elegans]|eukprot:NP_001309628.1 OToPetrin-Like [Caenorhabditis elegans]